MIIPGVEITTSYQGEIIEILGYGFASAMMQKLLKENILTFEQKQVKEYELLKKVYQEKGVVFDEKNINFNPSRSHLEKLFGKK